MKRFQFTSHDLGVDLGTSNILINVDDQGVVVREPCVVAVDRNTGKVLQVGSAARNMLGRTPGNVVAMYPLRNGIISDYEMTVKMLQILFRNTSKATLFTPKPRVVLSVPSGITEMEERTVINALTEAGARRVYLIEEPHAAAVGAGLDISGPNGHMVVDVGGGTTDIAVLSMGEVAISTSINTAGVAFDEAIARYIRRKYDVIIGQTTAEDIKIQIGTVYPMGVDASMVVRGRDASLGVPRELMISASELHKNAIGRLGMLIAEEVRSVFLETSPELVSDISANGITLTGGGSQIAGLDRLISEHVGVTCTVADDPHSAVAYGCGKALSWMNHMNEGPINIARKRLLRQG